MKLWHRLFLALVLTASVALLGQLAWQQWAFSRSFGDYLDAVAIEQAERVSERLARLHDEEGGWERLRAEPARMGAIVAFERDGGPERRGSAPDHSHPPGSHAYDAPQHDDAAAAANPGPMPAVPAAGPAVRHGAGAPPRRPHRGPPRDDMTIGARFALYDGDGRYVAGNTGAESASLRVPIGAPDSAIGEIRIAALRKLPVGAESDFARRQARGAWIASFGLLLLSLLLAFALARWLRSPLELLADGARRLAAGDYAFRCAVERSDEIGALARDFNRLAEALEQSRRSRQRWSADVAHELRTPLTVLRSELQLLADGVRPLGAEAVASLQQEIEQLTELVEDLNQLTLADAGALDYRFATIDLVDVVADAADRHRHRMRASGLSLEWDDPAESVPVRGDRRRLAQTLDNLLINAARYTDAPGRVRLRVGRSDQGATLRIDDTPPAVAASDLARLFDRWYRADPARSRRQGGSGLGLAICRAIVDGHGGRIEAGQSELGGLQVIITLPLETELPCAPVS